MEKKEIIFLSLKLKEIYDLTPESTERQNIKLLFEDLISDSKEKEENVINSLIQTIEKHLQPNSFLKLFESKYKKISITLNDIIFKLKLNSGIQSYQKFLIKNYSYILKEIR